MNKFVIFLIILFNFYNCALRSQTIQQLDEKNGFKDFKFGDPLSKWYKNLSDSTSIGKNEAKYVYNGFCCTDVFDTPIYATHLIFANNKLVAIYLHTKPFQDKRNSKGEPDGVVDFNYSKDMYRKLLSKFYAAFGDAQVDKPTEPDSDHPYRYNIAVWEGAKVRLIVEWDGGPGFDYAKITVLEKTNLNKRLQSGF